MVTSLATLSPPAIVETTTLGVPSLFFENVKVPVWPSSYVRFHTPTRSLKLSGVCAIAGAAATTKAAESSHFIAVLIGIPLVRVKVSEVSEMAQVVAPVRLHELREAAEASFGDTLRIVIQPTAAERLLIALSFNRK